MAQSDLVQTILSGKAPKNIRLLIARGSAPLPPHQTLELIVALLKDHDPEIAAQSLQTLKSWDQEEITNHLKSDGCAQSVLNYFAENEPSDSTLDAVILNPSVSGEIIAKLASTVSPQLLGKILDNHTRIIESPAIIESIKKNPFITSEIKRLVQEIEFEFFSDKKKEYAVEKSEETITETDIVAELESNVPLDDFSLEGLPVDPEARQAELLNRITRLTPRQKIHHALFGNREIRAILIRDTNKEVSKSVLKSPKLTESEVETISSMRGVSDDILRDIGNSREWTKSYIITQNLVKNPKTPPLISQRLLFRLHSKDLMMLSRDRTISDAVRQIASRTLNQRLAKGNSK
jgi:hypothetical protein